MKSKYVLRNAKLNYIFCLLIGLLVSIQSKSQCNNQVTHVSGTSTVNGINITVTPFGSALSTTSYCPEVTQPFWIGHATNSGGYLFQFSPPVDSVTLNFIYIDNNTSGKEIVKLHVNGVHYQVPNVGTRNGCDSLAILTPFGNITGCVNCVGGGWKGTTIAGPISSLSVTDSIFFGYPNGSIFSLYVCNSSNIGIVETSFTNLKLLPNPTKSSLRVSGINVQNTQLSLLNLFGQSMTIQPIVQDDELVIDCSSISSGLYFLIIEMNGTVSTRKILIE